MGGGWKTRILNEGNFDLFPSLNAISRKVFLNNVIGKCTMVSQPIDLGWLGCMVSYDQLFHFYFCKLEQNKVVEPGCL